MEKQSGERFLTIPVHKFIEVGNYIIRLQKEKVFH